MLKRLVWIFSVFAIFGIGSIILKSASVFASRASSTSSLWSGWTRCLRVHRACCITPCWGCVRTSRAAPASAAVWGQVFLEDSPCIINTCTTTATWTLRRLEGLLCLIFFLDFISFYSYRFCFIPFSSLSSGGGICIGSDGGVGLIPLCLLCLQDTQQDLAPRKIKHLLGRDAGEANRGAGSAGLGKYALCTEWQMNGLAVHQFALI